MKFEELKQLSTKQVLAIVGFWNSAPDKVTRKMFKSFTEFVGAIEKSSPYHENSPMLVNLKTDEPGVVSHVTSFNHIFSDMYESEEEVIIDIIKGKLGEL